MSKKENQSITYIYDEMDPSEKLEFERNLENDNNLLIEVETFKKVSEKLFELKAVQPPEELYEAVLNKAFMMRQKQKPYTSGRYMFVAAALVIIGLTSGLFLMNSNETGTENETGSAIMGTPEIILNSPVAVPGLIDYATTVSTGSPLHTETSRIEPWVDENDVINFYDRFRSTNNASLDSMFHDSFQKLTPVTDPSQSISIQRHLHLTGGRR
jgi:hypothetical protein